MKAWIEARGHGPVETLTGKSGQFDIAVDGKLAYSRYETGIDYGALADAYLVRLYGKFTRPNTAFDQTLQRTLAEAYKKSPGVKPLPFRSGYEKNAGSALQVAIRKGTGNQPPRSCVSLASK